MTLNKRTRSPAPEKIRNNAQGFSLLEVLFATVILSVGLLGILSLFSVGINAVRWAQEDQIAKQKAREAVEAVYSARNDGYITFDQIKNITAGGVFKNGFVTMYKPGSNGLPGTGQDTTVIDFFQLPGPDGVLGTADDIKIPLVNFQRQILLTDVINPDGSTNPDYRKLAVTVRVTTPGRGTRDYTELAYVSRFQ